MSSNLLFYHPVTLSTLAENEDSFVEPISDTNVSLGWVSLSQVRLDYIS